MTDERWARLVGEMRDNQRRVSAEPRPRAPKTAIAAAAFLLALPLVQVPAVQWVAGQAHEVLYQPDR